MKMIEKGVVSVFIIIKIVFIVSSLASLSVMYIVVAEIGYTR